MEKKKRKIIQSEGREIIAKVYHFLKEEYKFTKLYNEPYCDISHLRNITKRTADAAGVGERTVQKILREERELPSTSSEFPSPLKNRRKRPNKVTVTGRTADAVRNAVRDIHSQKQIPTLLKLSTILNEKIQYDGCLSTLRKLLKKMGYTWSKTENNKKVLIERHEFQLWRYQYLKKIFEYRSQCRPIVFTDASYVTTTQIKNCTAANKDAQPATFKTGTRYVLIHAGTEDGFIDNACLVFKANATSGDIHPIISFENYFKWVDEKLLPNLPENAVVILNNAPHNTFCEKMPTPQSGKTEMQAWLTSKGIPFDPFLHRLELYDIIKKNKSTYITYKIDNYIRNSGFEVLRLPPQHPELNCMLYILEIVKNYMCIVEDDLNSPDELIQQGLQQITTELWKDTYNIVMNKETQYMKDLDSELVLADLVKIRDNDDMDDGDETESEESSDEGS